MLAGRPAGVSVVMQHKEHAQPFEYAFHLLSVLCAYGLGSLARVQRAYTAALEDRARRLERERAADNARATAQERARIARDMHDILAHAVSLMVVQAEAGPVVVRSDPERAEAAFEAIAGRAGTRWPGSGASSGCSRRSAGTGVRATGRSRGSPRCPVWFARSANRPVCASG